MEKKSKVVSVIIAGIVVVILAVGVAFALMSQKTAAPQPTDQQETTDSDGGNAAGIQPESEAGDEKKAVSVTIVYTDDGFSPADYTVKAGSVVQVTNKSSSPLQFSSDSHPSHTHETELNLETLETGESSTFTPTKTGKWGFHDHLNASNTGTLTVE